MCRTRLVKTQTTKLLVKPVKNPFAKIRTFVQMSLHDMALNQYLELNVGSHRMARHQATEQVC